MSASLVGSEMCIRDRLWERRQRRCQRAVPIGILFLGSCGSPTDSVRKKRASLRLSLIHI
eukprot:9069648-Alexandrium_andersonii.AAC.1